MEISQTICEILCSKAFKEKLEFICLNYSNIKQESHIRNAILELFNNKNLENQRAFAEHPRENGRRVDLSIVNLENSGKEDKFTIEFKYNFPKDANAFRSYERIIKDDFERIIDGIRTSMFIQIVAQWEKDSKKALYDKKWKIKSNLERFVDNNNCWLNNIRYWFNCYKNKEYAFAYEIEPIFTETLDTKYYFFILSREEFNFEIKEMPYIITLCPPDVTD